MKLVDANVLIYSVHRNSAHHRAAKAWLDNALSGRDTVGFAWIVLLAFLRLTTDPRVFESPLATHDAIAVVEAWLAASTSVLVTPGAGHIRYLGHLLEEAGTGGNLVNDAHLAALALENKGTVVTFDRDFGRFDGVAWHRPRPATD